MRCVLLTRELPAELYSFELLSPLFDLTSLFELASNLTGSKDFICSSLSQFCHFNDVLSYVNIVKKKLENLREYPILLVLDNSFVMVLNTAITISDDFSDC